MTKCCHSATVILLCVLLHRMSGQNECERCSYEGHVFDRLVDMQVEMKQLKGEMQILKDSTDSHRKQLSDDMTSLAIYINRSLMTLNSSLEKALTPMIAFSAYNAADITPQEGQIIVFSKVLLNIGGCYDATLGIFTAPVKGLYHFTAHLCNAYNTYMVFSINQDGIELAISNAFENASVTCSSVTALVILEVGQKVTVRGKYDGNQLLQNDHRRSSFVGMLVHQ